jgi:DNA-binding LacI/PurR family transcriptional regulator
MEKQITIKDIANAAKVSIATVSRVMNMPEKVAPETKQKINQIMKDMKFTPNAFAVGLIKNTIKTVCIILPDINNLFYPPLLRGIEDRLQSHGYNGFICNTDKSIEKEMFYIENFIGKNVDGFVFVGTRPLGLKNNEHLLELNKRIPIIMVNDDILGSNIYSVMTDEVNGAYIATTHLIKLGHKKIAFINGNEKLTTYEYKLQGYKRALEDNDISFDKNMVICGIANEKGGFYAGEEILASSIKPTAFFTESDQIAMGLVKSLFFHGYHVPGDFSVVGFGGVPLFEQLYPGLTTIDQFPYKTGEMAADKIIKIINGEKIQQRKTVIEPELIIRESCKAFTR